MSRAITTALESRENALRWAAVRSSRGEPCPGEAVTWESPWRVVARGRIEGIDDPPRLAASSHQE